MYSLNRCVLSATCTYIHLVWGVTDNCLTHLSPYLPLVLIHTYHGGIPAITSHFSHYSSCGTLCDVFMLLTQQNTYVSNSWAMPPGVFPCRCTWLPLIQTQQTGWNTTQWYTLRHRIAIWFCRFSIQSQKNYINRFHWLIPSLVESQQNEKEISNLPPWHIV